MKSITVRQLRHDWPQVSAWLKSGVEIQVTERGTPITKMIPLVTKKRKQKRPDFMARLKKIYGDRMCATTGTELVAFDRGEV